MSAKERQNKTMTIEGRLNKLERSCLRHRWINFALAAVVLLIVWRGCGP